MAGRRIAIGVDVGGSAIKAGIVDVVRGRMLGDRIKVPTPQPSTPSAVVDSIHEVVKGLAGSADPDALVGVGIPSVVIDGVSWTAANIDKSWVGFKAQSALRKSLRRSVTVLNDADAAGIAEMRFGAGRDVAGVVLILTLGTGVGSALFADGRLVPNTELGHMEIRGKDAEKRSAAVARVRDGKSWKEWAHDLEEHLKAIDRILWPGLIILGGGVSRKASLFVPFLSVRPPVVPAALQNDAGIVGAAMAAIERKAPA